MANSSTFPLRPPGAVDEALFLGLCVQCGQCAHVCPYGAVTMATETGLSRNTPVIQPRTTPCYLCMKCPPQCPTGALNNWLRQPAQAAMGKAVILRTRCYNYTGGVMCSTCYDRCPLRGKAVVLQSGIIPEITDDCVGCGVCEYVCPVQAVVTLSRGEQARGKTGAK